MTMLLKLVLAPALVVMSSMAGRRWGQQVSGMLVALPIVAGPILLITCLEQGTGFGSRAAAGALLGLVPLALFALIFAWLSRCFGWVSTLLISWASCLLIDLVLSRLALGPWWDLPARAVATALLVLVVTAAAATLGPDLTGVLAPFPIATSVVAAFALAQLGSPGAVRVLHGVPRGLLGFSVFCFLVVVLVVPLGTGMAFVIALGTTLTVQVVWRAVMARLAQPARLALAGRSAGVAEVE